MPAQKATVPRAETSDFDQELQYLYERKAAIDAVIASLEEYERYWSVPAPTPQLKTA